MKKAQSVRWFECSPALLPPCPHAPESMRSAAELWHRLYYKAEPDRFLRVLNFRGVEPYFPDDLPEYASLVSNQTGQRGEHLQNRHAELLNRREKIGRALARFPELKCASDRRRIVELEAEKADIENWLRYVQYLAEGDARIDGDIQGFALECVESEAERLGQFIHPDVAPDCERLVRRFFEFAAARHRYHRLMIERVFPEAAQRRQEAKPAARTKLKSLAQLNGKRTQWKFPEEDLWLILSWPVATEYRWSYADVERARRVRFELSAAKFPLRIDSKATEARDRSVPWRLITSSSSAERDWIEAKLRVGASDRKRIEQRCHYLGLPALGGFPGRPSKAPGVPEMVELMLTIRP